MRTREDTFSVLILTSSVNVTSNSPLLRSKANAITLGAVVSGTTELLSLVLLNGRKGFPLKSVNTELSINSDGRLSLLIISILSALEILG